jgi:hypothetical protein
MNSMSTLYWMLKTVRLVGWRLWCVRMAWWAAVGGGGGVAGVSAICRHFRGLWHPKLQTKHGNNAPAGGRWVHRPPAISSAIAAGTAQAVAHAPSRRLP